jgi:hypothetical protein
MKHFVKLQVGDQESCQVILAPIKSIPQSPVKIILQLHLVFLILKLHILDRIPLRIPNRPLKLLSLLGARSKQMLLDQPLRRLAQPLEQREVLELVGTEDFENLDGLVVAEVLDEVAHVAGDHADVAGLEVKSSRGAFCGEDGYARATFDEEGPFVCVGWEVC